MSQLGHKKVSHAGTRIGRRFVLREPLGRGGMAEVWLAWDEQLEIDVALKLLVPQVALDEEGINRFRTRFQREADAIRRLDSQHIVRLVDVGEHDGELYMALSFVNGQPISSLLKTEGAQPPNRVREIARQMAVGLAAAHSAGVMHRDLKPANVMLTRTAQGRDHVVLVDFGIAHVLRSATGETLTRITSEGSMIGTPRYLPPEYIRGDQFDERSDLFALGLILYELLEGAAAVGGQDTVQIIARHLDKAPFRLRPHIVQADPGLASIVHALLEKRPEARLQSAEALHSALMDGGVVKPALVEPTHTVGQKKDESVDITTIAAAVFILFLAVAGGFIMFGGADTAEGEAMQLPEQVGAPGLIIDEKEAVQVVEQEANEQQRKQLMFAVDEASLKTTMALIDAEAAAKPREEDDPSKKPSAADRSSNEPKNMDGWRIRLPENDKIDEIRKVVPKLTIE